MLFQSKSFFCWSELFMTVVDSFDPPHPTTLRIIISKGKRGTKNQLPLTKRLALYIDKNETNSS
jgi:hypothetical protein